MSDRRRFYLTTAIAYANNAPGLHTVYEVIGADVVARWHRMLGDETRFLTGTDEHSREHRPVRRGAGHDAARVRRREGGAVPDGRGRAAHQPGPVHPDHGPGPLPLRPGDGPPRVRQRRHLPRHVRGVVLPQRGLQGAVGPVRDGQGHAVPQPPRRRAPVADRAQLVLPPVGLPAAAAATGTRRTRTSSSPTSGATRCSASSARGWRTSRSAGPAPRGASRSRSARTARPRSARTARGTRRPGRSTSGTTR